MVQRFFLGLIESTVSPGFMILTSMFYKKSEQPIRLGIWYSATGLFSIFSGVLNFAIGHADGNSPWHYMYALAGGFTIVWGILCYFMLPDSPLKAPSFLFSDEEKQLAVLRIRDESTGVENKTFKLNQVVEALVDPKVWAFFILGAAIYVVNGGVTAFGAYIIKSFGYSSLQTLLLLTPGGATTMVSIYISALFAAKVRNSRIVMLIFTCLFPIVGACMIWKGDWSNRAGKFPYVFNSGSLSIFQTMNSRTRWLLVSSCIWCTLRDDAQSFNGQHVSHTPPSLPCVCSSPHQRWPHQEGLCQRCYCKFCAVECQHSQTERLLDTVCCLSVCATL